MKRLFSIYILSALMLACTTNKTVEPTMSFDEMLNQYYEEGLKLNPINATYAGDSRYNDLFPNFLSEEYTAEQKAYCEKYLGLIKQYTDETLTEEQQLSKDIVEWECEMALQDMQYKKDLTPIDQMWSINLVMGQFASGQSAQPFETVEDYEKWLKRVDGYLIWLKTAKEKMQEGIQQDWVLPKSLIIKVIPQLEAMTNETLEENLFYSPALNFPDSFTDKEKAELKAKYTEMVQDKIIPAYRDIAEFVKTDYLEAGRATSGYGVMPGGEDFYQHQIKLYTTTNMTAAEIHQLGLDEVARISAEMEKVKAQVGYEGDLVSFFDYVRNKKELMPFTDPQQVLDYFDGIHETMKPNLEKLFDKKPKTPFEVRRTEAFREKSASAEYNPGSLDGTRPGIFYVPIPDVKEYNIYDNESLFLHEAIPGHHYQISLTQESEVLPMFRKTLWYSGYGEGWALYAESLGKELGLYTDPYQYFGALSAEIHRAIRLVVDTGIHSKGWTREESIQYSLEHEAEPEYKIIREVERYMANPGQALSYKIGQLKIRELRNKAESQLGDKFNIGVFHDQVLETGCIPLALLETKIDKWIASNK
ncbi:MAG: DUF885 family protein [Bacteroidota bacterium]